MYFNYKIREVADSRYSDDKSVSENASLIFE